MTSALESANYFTEISEERRKLNAILSQSTDAIVTTDEAWQVAIFNQAAEKLFDIMADEVYGRAIQAIPQLTMLAPIFQKQRQPGCAGRNHVGKWQNALREHFPYSGSGLCGRYPGCD
ncbi:MAG: cell wall metabolism sensor histidine kinase WalK [Chloroflexi bacterium]|nr:cell wall metabolism sensor histidine kinase WalK [Chloroflexota bacterium]